jgi:hypothetical protein
MTAVAGAHSAKVESPVERDLSPSAPYPTDFKAWKVLGWMGPLFVVSFALLFGVLAGNLPPFPASAGPQAVWQHYADHRLSIMIGCAACLTFAACYIAWSVAVAKVMERIEGQGGMWSQIERLGATITYAPPLVALVMWAGAAHEIHNIDPGTAHLLYWMGWFLVDLGYMVTSWQIIGVSIVFIRDRREKKLVPDAVSWWGWVTVASFFAVNAIPYVKTGPLAFDGVISFWIAFGCWFTWIGLMSYYILKAIDRLKAEDAAAQRVDV